MHNIKYLKFGIDLIMAVTFVLFFNKQVLGGLAFHEIAGLAIAVVFFTHVLLNWRWVKNVTLKLFKRKFPLKTKFSYLLNLLLLIGMAFTITSGIFISRVVFPNINVANEQWFKIAHITISYLVLIIVAIHVGLHWKWIISVFKNITNLKSPKRSFTILARVATIALFLFGSYEMYSTNFLMRVKSATNILSVSSSQKADGEFEGKGRHNFSQKSFSSSDRPTPPEGNFGDNDKPTLPSGSFGDHKRPDFSRNHEKGERGRDFQSPNALSVITKYFAIMSVIIIIVYYIQKLTSRKKRKQMTTSV